MAKLQKAMCKIAKDGLKEHRDEILAEVTDPKYICKKCLRTASDKELLCKPVQINK